jgi:dihydrofolate synthase/folylpolyglutamate synthase
MPAPDRSVSALDRLRARGPVGIRLGLGRMRALLRELGDPQAALRGALIGGTNGKGSTQAMVGSVLRAAGYHVGQAPSPHLVSYRERIVVDGVPIAAGDLDAVVDEVLAASLPGERRHGPATEFESLMATAFLWFARRGVEVAVIEVGLGGRLDATNAWDGGVAAITNVGLDHQEYLGDTIAAIAREKAAIIKRGDLAVTGAVGEALAVIAGRARRVEAPLRVCPPLAVERVDASGTWLRHERAGRLRLGLLGRHQAANAAAAIGTLEALSDAGIATVTREQLRDGLAGVRWPGRLERLEVGGVAVLLDGAHNPDGCHALAGAWEDIRPGMPDGRVTLLLGMLRDKDVAGSLAALAASTSLRSAGLVASSVPGTQRALPAADLAAAWAAQPGTSAAVAALDDADGALTRALERAAREGGALVVAGSLYLVGHVRGRLLGVDADA